MYEEDSIRSTSLEASDEKEAEDRAEECVVWSMERKGEVSRAMFPMKRRMAMGSVPAKVTSIRLRRQKKSTVFAWERGGCLGSGGKVEWATLGRYWTVEMH